MPRYTFKAASFRTGRIIADLPLVKVSAQKRLDFGKLDAQLPLHGRPLEQCRRLLAATTPGIMTVAVFRDGKLMGEWLLWTRPSRTNGPEPVPISGIELGSYLSHLVVDGWTPVGQADQLVVAYDLAFMAINTPPGLFGWTIALPASSGVDLSDVDYPTGTDYIGALLSELGARIGGFDWWVESDWDTTASTPTLKRTIHIAHPFRGRVLNAVINVPRRRGSSGLRFTLGEDATRVATTVYMTGTGEGDKQLYSRGLNVDLLRTYPALHAIDSRSSYDQQALLDAETAAMAAASRTAEIPAAVQVKADGDLQLGTYSPGDIVPVRVQACENFPDGYAGPVRIIGYTMTPPADGTEELVDVEIGRADDLGFDS